jgi:hypothetical protein
MRSFESLVILPSNPSRLASRDEKSLSWASKSGKLAVSLKRIWWQGFKDLQKVGHDIDGSASLDHLDHGLLGLWLLIDKCLPWLLAVVGN